MSSLFKNISFAVVFALIVWLGYSIFFKDDEALTTESNETSLALIEGQQFLIKLEQLRRLEFDGGIFDDPEFQSLVDHRQSLIDEPYGRANPFAPVR